ncbi:MAG: 4-(cytidine 5'-diphospho)-2-C-methyl-D-erythritol kinase [Acidimicrobiia bacterium]
MRALAHAKVNLALIVRPRAADGYHPLRGIYQSIDLCDIVTVEPARSDQIEVSNGEAPEDETNLAWRALEALRRAGRDPRPCVLRIDKRIPSGAGLGGGSADAAATIGLLRDRYSVDREFVIELASALGEDVPFALTGGSAIVRGRGDMIDPIEPLAGFALGLVVPPFSLATPAVFAEWDRLGGPEDHAIPDSGLPPALRGREPIRNDLYPAARSLDPRIAEWRDELASLWHGPVAMTGSGSALFGFFPSLDEAAAAVAEVPIPARAAVASDLVERGWRRIDD